MIEGLVRAVPVRWAWRIGILALGAILCAIHLKFSGEFPKTADQANSFRAGLDVLHGDWRLHGWYLVPDNFYTSDVVLSTVLAALSAAFGHEAAAPRILTILPALLWTTLVVAAIALAVTDMTRSRDRIGAVAVVLALLGLPLMRETVMYFITLSAIHVGTLIYCLAAFWLADRACARPAATWRDALVFLCLMLAEIGDPMTGFIAWLPLCAALVLERTTPVPRRLLLGSLATAGILCARWLLGWNTAHGGFRSEVLDMQFAPFDSIGGNAALCVQALLQLFSADFTGRRLTDAFPELLHLPLLGVAAWEIGTVMRSCLAMWDRQDVRLERQFLPRILAFAAAIDVLALLVSNRGEIESGSIACARYLFPCWVFGAVLLARRNRWRRSVAGLAAICLLVSFGSDLALLTRPSRGVLWPPQLKLMQLLLQHGTRLGIGTYGNSTNLSVASHGRLDVLPAFKGADGKLHALPRYH